MSRILHICNCKDMCNHTYCPHHKEHYIEEHIYHVPESVHCSDPRVGCAFFEKGKRKCIPIDNGMSEDFL